MGWRISYIFISISKASGKAKKYGQSVYPKEKQKLSLKKVLGLANKGLDFLPKIMEKIKK